MLMSLRRTFAGNDQGCPRYIFLKATSTLATEDKADIFTLRFIAESKAATKSVNPTLTRNSSFKSFGLSLSTVLDRLKEREFVQIIDGEEQNNGEKKNVIKFRMIIVTPSTSNSYKSLNIFFQVNF